MLQSVTIGNKNCLLHTNKSQEQAVVVFIQLTARHENKSLTDEMVALDNNIHVPYLFVGVKLDSWAQCLMPWADEAVSHDEEVGRHAIDTLYYIEKHLLPWLKECEGMVPCVIGGYSLGGLFALWAAYLSNSFNGVAAVSPSVWIKNWISFAECHVMKASTVYLSLGNREEHARNKRMAAVGECIRRQHELLLNQISSSHTILEWNEGGHFNDEAARMARGFIWSYSCLLNANML